MGEAVNSRERAQVIPDGTVGVFCSTHGLICLFADNEHGRSDSIQMWTDHVTEHRALVDPE